MHTILICLLAAAFLLLSVLSFRKRGSRQYGTVKYKSIPITKLRLVWIANKHNVFSILCMALAFVLVFALSFLTERMEIIPALIACGVCFVLVLLLHLPRFVLQGGAWKMMQSIAAFDALTRGKTLEYDNGSWCYCSRELLICVGRQAACILYAPLVDFSKKAGTESGSFLTSAPKTHSSIHYKQTVIPLNGGGKTKQLIPCNRAFCEWFRSHGGRIPGAD